MRGFGPACFSSPGYMSSIQKSAASTTEWTGENQSFTNRLWPLALLFLTLFFPFEALSLTDTPALIELDRVRIDDQVSFTPSASNLAPGEYRYRMVLIKRGKSGNSSSQQSGRLQVNEEGHGTLSTSSVNISPGDHCELSVFIDKNQSPFLEKHFSCDDTASE